MRRIYAPRRLRLRPPVPRTRSPATRSARPPARDHVASRGERPARADDRHRARDATTHELRFVHTESLIEKSPPPPASPAPLRRRHLRRARSYEAALRAAGGTLAATEAVLRGEIDSAFCFVRPPGHHATPDRAMGFCLFNNVAVAAARALEEPGNRARRDHRHRRPPRQRHAGHLLRRPARPLLLDAPVPALPRHRPLDRDRLRRGRRHDDQRPAPRGLRRRHLRRCYDEICAPAVRRFRPQLIFVSAGFDAHFADPLAGILLSTRGYYDIATLKSLADELCEGRVVYALEGGYDLTAIAWSARACMDTLLGNAFAEDPLGAAPAVPGPDVEPLLARIKEAHGLSA